MELHEAIDSNINRRIRNSKSSTTTTSKDNKIIHSNLTSLLGLYPNLSSPPHLSI